MQRMNRLLQQFGGGGIAGLIAAGALAGVTREFTIRDHDLDLKPVEGR